jgi:hypothetical protein
MIAKLSLVLLLLGSLAISIGCAPAEPVRPPDQPAEPPPPEAPPELLSIRVIASGSTSPAGPVEDVYRDAERWRALRQGLRDVAYEPSFTTEGVLIAAVQAPTGGYNVRFDSVYVLPARDVVAIYTVEEPGDECFVTQALTEPFQVIAVPGLPEGAVRFVQRRETYSC